MFNKENLNPKELAVFELIAHSENPITQLDISRHERWLGIHIKYENHLPIPDKEQSTLRQIRAIIRDLRLLHDAPIVSSIEGYFIPSNDEQIAEYVRRSEKVAKAQAASWLETYRHMKKVFGDAAQSDFFESQGTLFD